MKSRYIKLPPELADGEHWTPSDNPLDIGDVLMRWMRNQDIGSKITLEIIELSEEERDALPSI
jgi:hypothetical protein